MQKQLAYAPKKGYLKSMRYVTADALDMKDGMSPDNKAVVDSKLLQATDEFNAIRQKLK